MSFAPLVTQAKYQSACEAGSVRIITPDWVVHSVEAMCRIDETRYHPRLLVDATVDHSSSAASPTRSLSLQNCRLEVSEPSSSTTAVVDAVRPPGTASEKPSVSPPVLVSLQSVRTHLKSIGNGNEFSTKVCQSTLKPFASTKVCININAGLLKVYRLFTAAEAVYVS